MELVPDEIRAIRERLGLSQAEAGKLLGGGPSAFTKYEAGTLKPAASLVNLLRVLDADPAAITTLGGHVSRPIDTQRIGPFDVTGRHIETLTERMFPELLRRMLVAEAMDNEIPASGVHVASAITTPDGGEDGRIEWTGGPDRTGFLPGRLCQFQLKTGRIKPAGARRDVLTTTGEVKDMVRSVLDAGGHYIVLSSHSYVQKEITARKRAIREGLRDAGMTIPDEQIGFRDADQIAQWANHHPTVAIWVKEQTHDRTIGPFRSWIHWAGRSEHDRSPWVDDGRLPDLRSQLRDRIMTTPGIARVVGPWGIGKSRLVLEALRPTAKEKAEDLGLSDLVLYTVESENRTAEIHSAVQSLVDATARAVVVVDRCRPETYRVLVGLVSRAGSRVSLITVDDDLSNGTSDETAITVGEAPSSVTEAIVNRSLPKLWPGDQSRLSRFAKGFPEIAIRLAEAWGRSIPIGHVTDDDLVDAIVLGHGRHEPDLLRKSARLIAVFGMVGVTDTAGGQLEEIATLGRNLTADDLRASIEDFVRRGVVQRRGRYVVFRPLTIAMKLAERQWREWSPKTREAVLSGNTSAHLKVLAARGLACLNTTIISQEVVGQVCRFGGAFDGWSGIAETGHAEVLSALAEVNAEVVVGQIERSLEDVDDLSVVSGGVRRHLVWALEKIAFRSDTFRDGARLLLPLAIAENEMCANNATGQFTDLFPLGGNTGADGVNRLDFLDEVGETTNQVQRTIVVNALSAGLSTGGLLTIYGAESQGSRPALERWIPKTVEQCDDYIKGCAVRLAEFAEGRDDSGVVARRRLARCLSSLIRQGYISVAESVIKQVVAAIEYWPEAHESLGSILVRPSDSMDQDVIERVRNLIGELFPKSMERRVRFLVTQMPREYPYDRNVDFRSRRERQTAAVHGLAAEIVKQPAIIRRLLPELCQGEQRMAYAFGKAVATRVESPLEWLPSIVEIVQKAPAGNRNYDLLWGYVMGIAEDYPDAVEAFKRKAATSSELVPILPRICANLGISASDVGLVGAALRAGVLRPSELMYWRWEIVTTSTSAVASLLEVMLDQGGDSLTEAVEMLGVYIDRAPERLEALRSQIVRLVGDIVRPGPRGKIDEYTFGEIVKWTLDKGRQDSDANAVALLLARAVVETEHDDKRIIRPLMPKLLSGFPEIAWQLIGPAIVADRGFAMLMERFLGKGFAFDRDHHPAILRLPEDVLFAWCHGHPDSAPVFAAAVVPVLTLAAEDPERSLHPIMIRLIDEFGDRRDVLSAIERNIRSFSWAGSLTTYYELYEKPLGTLRDHPKTDVRRWAVKMLRRLAVEIENARSDDEEEDAESELP